MRKIVTMIGLLLLACSHANTMDVQSPTRRTQFDASAGYWKNTGEIKAEENPSDYERCLNRKRGMDPKRAELICEQFILAGQPELQRPEPSPCLYCSPYGYGR